jgi:hypothetical protein
MVVPNAINGRQRRLLAVMGQNLVLTDRDAAPAWMFPLSDSLGLAW